MHQLLTIGFHIAAITSADLSEPPELWIAILVFALILLRRRPFARSKRHPVVSNLLTGIADAKEQILSPLKRILRSAEPKAPTQPWIWMGFERLEGRQLMSGSAPSPTAPPPAQNEPAIEQSIEAKTAELNPSAPSKKI
jgi:hypothetical protein